MMKPYIKQIYGGNDVINKLNQNPKVRIVTPNNFMKLINENVKSNS